MAAFSFSETLIVEVCANPNCGHYHHPASKGQFELDDPQAL
jgi:hypothetical protein